MNPVKLKRLLSLPIKGENASLLSVDVLLDTEANEHELFIADFDVDCDGVDDDGNPYNPDGDPYYQPDTSLHHNGQALNAYKVEFIVVPMAVVNACKGIVLGCQARATNTKTGQSVWAVVGDTGPKNKLGEGSPACASAIGIDPNPNNGGEDSYDAVLYELWPGTPALVNGVLYTLQPS